jgi:excisionase family DNA binding protein
MLPLPPSFFQTELPTNDPQRILLERWFSLSDQERTKQFLDTKQASRHMAVSQRTIRFWIEFGNIRAIRIGKKYHIYKNSLVEFISKRALLL